MAILKKKGFLLRGQEVDIKHRKSNQIGSKQECFCTLQMKLRRNNKAELLEGAITETSSETKRFEDLDVLQNDKRRMEEWDSIFSSIRKNVRSFLSSNFRSWSSRESTQQSSERQKEGNVQEHETKSSTREPDNFHLRSRELQRESDQGRLRRGIVVSKKSSNLLTGDEELTLDIRNGKNVHNTATGQGSNNLKHMQNNRGSSSNTRVSECDQRRDTAQRYRGRDEHLRTSAGEERKAGPESKQSQAYGITATTVVTSIASQTITSRNEADKRPRRNRQSALITNHQGMIVFDVGPVLQIGVQISNGIGGVLREVSKEAEKKAVKKLTR